MSFRLMDEQHFELNRRRFLVYFSAVGVGATLLPGALAAVAQDAETITFEMLDAAQAIAGITFTREEQQRILERLNGDRSPLPAFEVIRDAGLGNDTQPAFVFNPVPPGKLLPSERRPLRREPIDVTMPTSDEELAFLPLTHLSRLLETRQIRSTELTELYLARLKEHDPKLFCVVNLTEDIARRQARQADEEIAAGSYRGPLHGIPWGLKDLLAVRGTKTTWGMTPFRDRVIDVDSTVYERLTEAGAVLVAKLSTGALATTARWYGGLTRNPWNTEQDAAGSSAGPGSATAAGLVGFSIGTDTGGSVIGPSTRNGLTGLRPTFGRVSRYGGMVLAWTQDTVGPMCRSAEDCALVFDAIYGPDGRDNTVLDVPFNWDAMADPTQLRVGYLRSEFEGEIGDTENAEQAMLARETRRNNQEALRVIRSLDVEVVPFDLPDVPVETIDFLRYVETSAAFYELTASGQLTETEQGPEQSVRPVEIRTAHFTPAVEYVQGNRMRMRIMEQVDEALGDLDLYLGSNILLTNRTGHPAVSLPNGFHRGSPTALHMTGKLFGESEILLLAHTFQANTDHHRQHPTL
ncbi:MAG: amidase [Gemmatimonadota bacterium]|nr:amidase [Gemmatimonadota bacterium]